MTTVFVHGVPESANIWALLISELDARGVNDIVTLSPPGFGSPLPDGWEATPAAYVEWLAGELEHFDGPVNLVGHDWGAGHAYGLAVTRPDLIRSWAADVAGLIHPDYTWHDMAQAWQQPEVGEQVIEMMVGQPPDDRRASFEALGLPTEIAGPMAEAVDEDMGRCILGLYRNAIPPFGAELGASLRSAEPRPGLVIDATDDPYVASELGREVAAGLGAGVLTLEGEGHWWMASAPAAAADGLVEFWK